MNSNTVTIVLTSPEENLTDLANAYAQMGFVAKWTQEELLTNIKNVIEEQYLQAILTSRNPA